MSHNLYHHLECKYWQSENIRVARRHAYVLSIVSRDSQWRESQGKSAVYDADAAVFEQT